MKYPELHLFYKIDFMYILLPLKVVKLDNDNFNRIYLVYRLE